MLAAPSAFSASPGSTAAPAPGHRFGEAHGRQATGAQVAGCGAYRALGFIGFITGFIGFGVYRVYYRAHRV